MMRFLTPLLFVGSLMACTTVPASVGAQALACGEPVAVREKLHGYYQEHLRGWGISDAGKLVEVYTNSKLERSWTILSQKPGEWVCVQAVGNAAYVAQLITSLVRDSGGRKRVWVGFSEDGTDTAVFEIFVDETDNSWQVKRSTDGTGDGQVMIEGTEWNEVMDEVEGRDS